MKSMNEEENKDGRYFPSDSEMQILIHYLQIYFSHPERSIQRSQVVQTVVGILSTTNKHWSHRTVRLWFNNNKRVFLRPNSPNSSNSSSSSQSPNQNIVSSQSQEIKTETSSSFSSQVKFLIPTRSLSVTQFPIKQEQEPQIISTPQYVSSQSKQPKRGTLAMELLISNENILQKPQQIFQAQVESENHITEKIISLHNQRLEELIGVQQSRTSLIDFSTVPQHEFQNIRRINTFNNNNNSININPNENKEDNLPTLDNYQPYELIESSYILHNGESIIITYNTEEQRRKIHIQEQVNDIEFLSPVTSIVYNYQDNLIWVHSDKYIKSYYLDTFENVHNLLISHRRSYQSVINFWNDNLVLATGSTILSWSPELLSQVKETEDEEKFDICLCLSLPNISSVTTLGESLVVGSSEYHSIQIYAKNGAIISRCIGHSSGITSLSSYDENMFLSGSADQTCKMWDLRVSQPIFNIIRHDGIVTSVFGNVTESPNLIFTGGNDGIVRCWDIREFKHLFTLPIGETSPQNIHYNHEMQRLTIVTSEVTSDYFYDNCKFGQKFDRNIIFQPNSVLNFHF